jgi:hypothetical protein
MPTTNDWVKLSEYGTRLEADIYVELLEAAEIPVVVRGPETGIFGPGFASPTLSRIVLLVPRSQLESALEVIEPGEELTDGP